jgi:sulfonate transport system ATP-binding protein
MNARPDIPPVKSAGGGLGARARGLHISMRSVSKAFGPREVLKGFDLDIPSGQFLAIVGRSGGGKSTLLRLIAGLDTPSCGIVSIDDRIAAGVDPRIRLLFQDARLVPWQRVLGNVGIARGRDWRPAASRALGAVGLADRSGDWPSVLSGGQKQRVALARALVGRPGVLLLDEPFGALDALTRIDMHRLIEHIWQEHGFTVVLITHDIAEAVALADRVVVLSAGAIVYDAAITVPRPRLELADPLLASFQADILRAV